MNLYKNGFIVYEKKENDYLGVPWPINETEESERIVKEGIVWFDRVWKDDSEKNEFRPALDMLMKYKPYKIELKENEYYREDGCFILYENWENENNLSYISPDYDYVKRYTDYCRKIGFDVNIVLVESPVNVFISDADVLIKKELGYDCYGTVFYSYLKTEYNEVESRMKMNNVYLNENNLCSSLDDIMIFINDRVKDRESGINIEDYWKEIPVRLSLVNY